MYIPLYSMYKIDEYLEILADEEVKDFVEIKFSEYFYIYKTKSHKNC